MRETWPEKDVISHGCPTVTSSTVLLAFSATITHPKEMKNSFCLAFSESKRQNKDASWALTDCSSSSTSKPLKGFDPNHSCMLDLFIFILEVSKVIGQQNIWTKYLFGLGAFFFFFSFPRAVKAYLWLAQMEKFKQSAHDDCAKLWSTFWRFSNYNSFHHKGQGGSHIIPSIFMASAELY